MEPQEFAVKKIDEFLTIMGCANANLSRFDGSHLMIDGGIHDTRDEMFVSYMGATTADLNHQWKVSLLGSARAPGDAITLYRSETLHWSQLGHFRKSFPLFDVDKADAIALYEWLGVDENGQVSAPNFMYIADRKGRLTVMDPSPEILPGDRVKRWDKHDKVILRTMQVQIGFAYMEPSLWIAKVSIQPDTPSVCIPTDPTGIKELWKFRDIPEGRKRRDALLHWVSGHYRKNRKDQDIEAYVRKHLRGKRELKCSGLSVVIKESREDRIAAIKLMEDGKRRKAKKKGGA